ncbi:MAG: hypothetical protein PHS09_02875 [Candidatus Omnitrophica bacterium]|nr:hypothetical protein [Candidatus Omnitrophota bacterium]MDD5513370.1 hypothetical protein [Candidatus Omnitrophota bacterium]
MRSLKRINLELIIAATITLGLARGELLAQAQDLETIKKIEEQEIITKKPVTIVKRPRVEYKGEGLRDPFRGRIETRAGAKASSGPPPLTVQGVIWGTSLPQAIISGKVVKIGDTIEKARIIDITKEGVTIFYEGQQYTLSSPGIVDMKSQEKKEKGGQDEK